MAATALASKLPAPHGSGVVTPAATPGVAAVIPIEIAPDDYIVVMKRGITRLVAAARASGCRRVLGAPGLSRGVDRRRPNGN